MLSVITCSIDPAKFDALQRNLAQLLANEPHEIIRVDDARSLCEGYNRGVARAAAAAEHFVFCHDDIEILSGDFLAKLKRHLRAFDVIGVAGTDRVVNPLWSALGPPHIHGQVAHYRPPPLDAFDVQIFSTPGRAVGNIQAMDGLFLAARRAVVERVRFDEQTFDGWHGYDVDWTFAAHLGGFRLGVGCDIAVVHRSVGNIQEQAWHEYGRRFLKKYEGRIVPAPRRKFQVAVARVATRAEALAVMTPPYWPPADETQPPESAP